MNKKEIAEKIIAFIRNNNSLLFKKIKAKKIIL
jgi:hypothetical protein